jgi:hypothetical protein
MTMWVGKQKVLSVFARPAESTPVSKALVTEGVMSSAERPETKVEVGVG